jgi:hypothetical protein
MSSTTCHHLVSIRRPGVLVDFSREYPTTNKKVIGYCKNFISFPKTQYSDEDSRTDSVSDFQIIANMCIDMDFMASISYLLIHTNMCIDMDFKDSISFLPIYTILCINMDFFISYLPNYTNVCIDMDFQESFSYLPINTNMYVDMDFKGSFSFIYVHR